MGHPYKTFRADIEAMRALAVGLVVAFHAGLSVLPGGFIGVDVFFAISGYLITGLLVAEHEQTGRISLAAFYARRGRRLLPAAFVMIAATLFIGHFVYSPNERVMLTKFAASASLYVSNIFFAMQPNDYFSGSMEDNPFLHTWSLAVEEQFYLVWPLLIFGALAVSRARKHVLILLSVVSLVSFLACLFWMETDRTWAFYGLPGRAWEFSLGGLARLVIQPKGTISMRWRTIGSYAGLALVVGSALLIHEYMAFPGLLAVPAIVGTILVLSLGGSDGPLDGLARQPVVQWLGKRSYAIYLWHWPYLRLADAWLGDLSAMMALFAVLACLLTAHLSYEYIENPIRRHGWLRRRTLFSLGGSAALTFGGAVVAFAFYLAAKSALAGPYHQKLFHTMYDQSIELEHECFVWPPTRSTVHACRFGTSAGSPPVILVGDSHARQWFPALRAVTGDRDRELVTYLKGGCAIAEVDVFSDSLGRVVTECDDWREAAINEIVAQRPSHVVLGTFARSYASNQKVVWPDNQTGNQGWVDGLRKTIVKLSQAGTTIVYVRQTPVHPLDVPICLGRAAARGQSGDRCTMTLDAAFDEELRDLEDQMLSQFDNVVSLDLTDAFCDSQICYAEQGDYILHRDSHHVSEAYARTLAERFSEALHQR